MEVEIKYNDTLNKIQGQFEQIMTVWRMKRQCQWNKKWLKQNDCSNNYNGSSIIIKRQFEQNR